MILFLIWTSEGPLWWLLAVWACEVYPCLSSPCLRLVTHQLNEADWITEKGAGLIPSVPGPLTHRKWIRSLQHQPATLIRRQKRPPAFSEDRLVYPTGHGAALGPPPSAYHPPSESLWSLDYSLDIFLKMLGNVHPCCITRCLDVEEFPAFLSGRQIMLVCRSRLGADCGCFLSEDINCAISALSFLHGGMQVYSFCIILHYVCIVWENEFHSRNRFWSTNLCDKSNTLFSIFLHFCFSRCRNDHFDGSVTCVSCIVWIKSYTCSIHFPVWWAYEYYSPYMYMVMFGTLLK